MQAGQKPCQGRIAFPSMWQPHLCDMEGPKAGTFTLNSP